MKNAFLYINIDRRQSPPYGPPVRDQRVIRDSNYLNNSSRPRYVDYYHQTQLQRLPQQQQFQHVNVQNSINTSNLPNDSNNQNNNNTNVGAHGLYEHLEVEKSMGVSPAPEIPSQILKNK